MRYISDICEMEASVKRRRCETAYGNNANEYHRDFTTRDIIKLRLFQEFSIRPSLLETNESATRIISRR